MADAVLSPEQRAVYSVYAMLAGSIILGLIPNIWCAIPALLLFCLTPYLARRERKKSPDGFIASHATFILRTIWVATAIAAVTMFAASFYLISHDDVSPLQPCVTTMTNAMQAGGQPSAIMLNRCIGPFLAANSKVFWISGITAAAPVLLYLIWRLGRGMMLARRNLPIPNPRSLI